MLAMSSREAVWRHGPVEQPGVQVYSGEIREVCNE
jgi:hypothetical protein